MTKCSVKANTVNPKFSKENFPTTISAPQHHSIIAMATKTEKDHITKCLNDSHQLKSYQIH